MATINSAFDLISGALDADQSALNIVANNVANANTVGYTRETPNWQENSPVQISGVSYGAGVRVTGPTSERDNILNQRLAQQQQAESASSARLSALDSLQALFAPDSGSTTSIAGDIGATSPDSSIRFPPSKPIQPTTPYGNKFFQRQKLSPAIFRTPLQV